MFDYMSVKQLRKIFFGKYIFQLLVAPLCLSICGCVICLFILSIKNGFYTALKDMFLIENFGKLNDVIAIIIVMYAINLANVISVPTSIKLLMDCIKRHEIEATIKINKLFPIYELQSIRQKKRFICDTFSRKANVEIYIYDEVGKKYRFLWNENYGGNSEDVERVLLEDVAIKIRYMKYSKIIVSCKMINDDA